MASSEKIASGACCLPNFFEQPKDKCISLITIVALLAISTAIVGVLAIVASLHNGAIGLGVMHQIEISGGIAAVATGGILFILTISWAVITRCHSEKVVWLDTDLMKFSPFNTWSLDTEGPKWRQSIFCMEGNETSQFIIDDTTGDKYLNQHPVLVSIKCGAAAIATPVVHTIGIPINVIYRVIRIVATCKYLHEAYENDKKDIQSYCVKEISKDILRIVVSPLILLILEIAALYGIFSPNDGKKVYANVEAAFYGRAILSGCFQPNPIHHTLGGDLDDPNAW